jgi:hypothetical protein
VSVNMPKRGIGEATVAAIESFAATEGIDVGGGVLPHRREHVAQQSRRRAPWPGSTK